MSTTDTSKIPNSLEEHWMPFTANRDFKENPRLITGAKGVYLQNHQGKTMIDASSGLFCNPLGHGTERLEESLRRSFPDEMVTRIDSDSTRLKGTLDKALTNATSGETKILVGTQMLSKGHHFPNLTLVAITVVNVCSDKILKTVVL